MDFLIADTFTDSLAKLTGDEQKATKITAMDLQLNPANPGLSFHKLDNALDKRFWSVRVGRDIRLIVHRTDVSLLLCYVDHHDNAYQWAERRKLETHPKTGAAQIVEIRERVEEIIVPRYVEAEQLPLPKPALFANIPEADLLSYGVPAEWLEDVRLANEDTILELAEHLPKEAAEALLDVATGAAPRVPVPVALGTDAFEHPDAQRRFRVMHDVEELERALDFPWEKWMVFLHPAQREAVEADYNGPARVSGSAGTGKTIVAMHRAVYLARRHPDARVLLTTFSEALANSLRTKLRYLMSNEPRLGERIEVYALNTIALRLYQLNVGRPQIASADDVRESLQEASADVEGQQFSLHFLVSEWEEIVDAWQLNNWEAYRDVVRLGRKTRLPERQREVLWGVFEHVRANLGSRAVLTYADMFGQLTAEFASKQSPFDFIVVDEAQDLSVPQLRFLAALGARRPDSLFFAGDLGQRIFQQPFSWKSLGVDVRGRSRTLRINYRTSHQIRSHADRLLGPQLADIDGNIEERRGTVSVFNGPEPTVGVFDDVTAEIDAVGEWLKARMKDDVKPHEMAVFVRSQAELERAQAALAKAGLQVKVLDENLESASGHVSISTMHLAKGLEFRAVVVMACDDEILPLQERIEAVSDDSDLEEVYNTERHLLYVACTRARDYLLITAVSPASEFLDDLRGTSPQKS